MFEFCIWVQRLPATQLTLMTLTTFCGTSKTAKTRLELLSVWKMFVVFLICTLKCWLNVLTLLLMVKENKKNHLHVEHQALSRKTGTAKVHYCLYRRSVQGCTICFSLSHFISYGYISCCCIVFAGSKGYSPLTSAAHWICSLYQTTIKSPK